MPKIKVSINKTNQGKINKWIKNLSLENKEQFSESFNNFLLEEMKTLRECSEKSIVEAYIEAANNVIVSSTKGNTGQLLGAAGAVEAIAFIKAIEDSFVPPTIGYKVPDEECDLDIVPNKGKNVEIKYAMSNSLGFGGHNSSIILKKYEE